MVVLCISASLCSGLVTVQGVPLLLPTAHRDRYQFSFSSFPKPCTDKSMNGLCGVSQAANHKIPHGWLIMVNN